MDVGSSDIHRVPPPAYPIHPTVVSAKDNNGISSCKLEDESSKWMMSKKIRIVQKMMNTAGSHDQKKQERIIKIKFPDLEKDRCEIDSPSHGGNVLVRICSDCKTTKTPLWRSGPQGPKVMVYIYIVVYENIALEKVWDCFCFLFFFIFPIFQNQGRFLCTSLLFFF